MGEKLPAGPDLDALVAVKVMGWTTGPRRYHCEDDVWRTRDVWGPQADAYCFVDEWRPSTEEGPALAEVKARLRGMEWVKSIRVAWSVHLGWRVRVYGPDDPTDKPTVFAWGDTEPEAVCLAALKAVEVMCAD